MPGPASPVTQSCSPTQFWTAVQKRIVEYTGIDRSRVILCAADPLPKYDAAENYIVCRIDDWDFDGSQVGRRCTIMNAKFVVWCCTRTYSGVAKDDFTILTSDSLGAYTMQVQVVDALHLKMLYLDIDETADVDLLTQPMKFERLSKADSLERPTMQGRWPLIFSFQAIQPLTPGDDPD